MQIPDQKSSKRSKLISTFFWMRRVRRDLNGRPSVSALRSQRSSRGRRGRPSPLFSLLIYVPSSQQDVLDKVWQKGKTVLPRIGACHGDPPTVKPSPAQRGKLLRRVPYHPFPPCRTIPRESVAVEPNKARLWRFSLSKARALSFLKKHVLKPEAQPRSRLSYGKIRQLHSQVATTMNLLVCSSLSMMMMSTTEPE